MISTRNLVALPDIAGFGRLTRALAMLDAIICPEPEYRYYSFNSHWADAQMMASMRNGSGDHWFALLCGDGIALHGLAHEAPMFRLGQPWPGIFEELPVEFHDEFLREPAFDTSVASLTLGPRTLQGGLPSVSDKSNTRNIELLVFLVSQTFARDLAAEGSKCLRRNTSNSTFCIWRRTADASWALGPVHFPAVNDPDGSEGLLQILSGDAKAYVEYARDYFEVDVSSADVSAVYEHKTLTSDLVRRLNPNSSLAALAMDIAEIGYPDAQD